MPGHQYTPAEYALQLAVDSSTNLRFELAEHQLTHTYAVCVRFCQLESLDYLVLRYLNTSGFPFEELSEEWLYDGET
jgi:hypothetical protein